MIMLIRIYVGQLRLVLVQIIFYSFFVEPSTPSPNPIMVLGTWRRLELFPYTQYIKYRSHISAVLDSPYIVHQLFEQNFSLFSPFFFFKFLILEKSKLFSKTTPILDFLFYQILTKISWNMIFDT